MESDDQLTSGLVGFAPLQEVRHEPRAGDLLIFPPWLAHFVGTARYSATLVDFLMLHEGPLQAHELPPTVRASNVRFLDVGAGGIATLVAKGMGEKLRLGGANITALATRMRFMFSKWPRLVAEYKPAFGSVFRAFLQNYTHWGYSDLDIVLGDVRVLACARVARA